MCGFLVTKEGIQCDFSKIRLRGGDSISCVSSNGFTFRHSLLSVTGEFTEQPYFNSSRDIVCLYNGEIYNHKFIKSDGEVLIPLYEQYGHQFPKELEGEFAIALYDFRNRRIVLATDDFGTKPLFHEGSSAGSYNSGVRGYKVPPNTILVKDMDTGTDLSAESVHDFDFSRQHKTDYNDWLFEFSRAIRRRSKHKCFIGLSSGYDSGAIACELSYIGCDFKAFVIANGEEPEVIRQRVSLIPESEVLTTRDYGKVAEHIAENVEDVPYNIEGGSQTSVFSDKAILGLGLICSLGKAENRKVYISGQGSDEILSDYSLFGSQSHLKGVYPEALYEWPNFRGSCQAAYLAKEEYIAGSYGIETRYPYLDRRLVQEFLWLSTKLKNSAYKAPLREYLKRHKFPFEENVKRGFNP